MDRGLEYRRLFLLEVKAYAYGSTLQVIAELGDWCQVVDPYTGITGFAMSKFLYR